MKIILIRHGETDANKLGFSQGCLNSKIAELNENGLEQSKRVSDELKGRKIDFIFSSPLRRASRTAEEIAKHYNCGVVYEERLREHNKGKYESKPKEEILKDFKKSGKSILEWVPENGESLGEVNKRAIDFIKEISNELKEKTVVVVSHGSIFGGILRYFHNDLGHSSRNSYQVENASISEYSFDGENWNEIKFNYTEHLR